MEDSEQPTQGKTQFPVKIRLMKSNEEKTLLQLQEKSIRELNTQDYNREQIEVIIDRICRLSCFDTGTVTFVAERESSIVGFATLNKSTSYINAIYVSPNCVRQGVGKQLMLAIEEEAIQRKIGDLFTFSSLTAINFYKALGYKIIEEKNLLSNASIEIPVALMIKQNARFTFFDRVCNFCFS